MFFEFITDINVYHRQKSPLTPVQPEVAINFFSSLITYINVDHQRESSTRPLQTEKVIKNLFFLKFNIIHKCWPPMRITFDFCSFRNSNKKNFFLSFITEVNVDHQQESPLTSVQPEIAIKILFFSFITDILCGPPSRITFRA